MRLMNTPKDMRHSELEEAYKRLSSAYDRVIEDYRTLEAQYELCREQFKLMTQVKTRDVARDIIHGNYGDQPTKKE